MENILIIGATSAIAEATARIYAQQGKNIYLLSRSVDKLESISNDLKVRGAASTNFKKLDVNNFEDNEFILDSVFKSMGKIDVVLIAHGTLPDQKLCEKNFNHTLNEINTNAISTISLLTHIANKFEQQRRGTIAVITSVAGDRGRQSNYVYGAAKSMVSTFISGLRNRLYKSNVNVLDIKPGFVDTPMTASFEKGVLWVKPDLIAKDIVNSINRKKQEIYTPFFWRYIMLVIRSIPGSIFNRLSL